MATRKLLGPPIPLNYAASAAATDLVKIIELDKMTEPGAWPVVLTASLDAKQNAAVDTVAEIQLSALARPDAMASGVLDETTAKRAEVRSVIGAATGGTLLVSDEFVPVGQTRPVRPGLLVVNISSVSTGYTAYARFLIGMVSIEDTPWDC